MRDFPARAIGFILITYVSFAFWLVALIFSTLKLEEEISDGIF